MVGFIVGLLIGCFFCVLVMSLCNVASDSDKYITGINGNKDKEKEDEKYDSI